LLLRRRDHPDGLDPCLEILVDFAQDLLKGIVCTDHFYGQLRDNRPGLCARHLPFVGPALVGDIGHIGTALWKARAKMEQHLADGPPVVLGVGKAIEAGIEP